jgi:DNA polymerase V
MVNRGGNRVGAGRKKNPESSVVKRIPASMVATVDQWLTHYKTSTELPKQPNSQTPNSNALALFSNTSTVRIPVSTETVQAGFPSPAEPHIANHIDFNRYLVRNPSATFAVYANGDSMIDAGISSGDLLIIDRSAEAKHKDIVLAEVDNAFTVKRFMQTGTAIALHPENASGKYPIIRPNEHNEIRLVGIVTHIIKKV